MKMKKGEPRDDGGWDMYVPTGGGIITIEYDRRKVK